MGHPSIDEQAAKGPAVDGGAAVAAAERAWVLAMRPYREPDRRRALFELVVTLVPFLALSVGLAAAVVHGWVVLYLLLLLPTAAFLVRLFMIQHDCGHGSFFPGRRANDWTGRLIGVLTLTPYDLWRRSHAIHHASAGNLDHRGIGDIDTLTVDEYRARDGWGRLRYRIYRHPLVMFGFGPFYLFVIQNRIPVGFLRRGAMPWVSTMATNAGVLALAAAGVAAIGLGSYLLVLLPVVVLAATAGVWLFYVQHQFEHTVWDHSAQWNPQAAALHGSSHYDLPKPLAWLTANIGIHHVHHLSSKIPFYRLGEVLRDHPALADIGRLSVRDSLACVRLVLWDEEARRLVPFAALRAG